MLLRHIRGQPVFIFPPSARCILLPCVLISSFKPRLALLGGVLILGFPNKILSAVFIWPCLLHTHTPPTWSSIEWQHHCYVNNLYYDATSYLTFIVLLPLSRLAQHIDLKPVYYFLLVSGYKMLCHWERGSEWVSESMSEWVDKWVSGWVSEWMSEWVGMGE